MIIFICDGGIGKNIMATAVIRAINKKFPDDKLVVVSGYPDVFLNNPRVWRSLPFGLPYFYDEYAAGSMILKSEPYLHADYLGQRRHLIDCWCEQLGVQSDGLKPELYPTLSERELAQAFVLGKKPLLLLQASGGPVPQSLEQSITGRATMHARSLPLPVVQELVNRLSGSFNIACPQQGQQMIPSGVTPITSLRLAFALVPHAMKLIVIDSFLMHAAAAFSKQAVVCWGGTSPAILGYECHVNLTKDVCPTPRCHRPNSYLMDYLAGGKSWECPYGQRCMLYSPDEIIDRL
jgi:hypothetical protein